MINDSRENLPSASSFRRYELCAGSFALEAEARRLGQEAHKRSPEADRGDRIHARLAGEQITLDESEETTANFLAERALEQVERIFGRKDIPSITERRLWLDYDGKKALSGRFDVVYFTDKLALVQDYKTGWREPDAAEQNAQLKVLAVLIGIALPTVEEIVVQLISGPYGVTEARYNLQALSEAYREIIATLRRINDPNAGFNPGPEQCRFCPAQLICQTYRDATVLPITKIQITQLPLEPDRASKLLDEVTMLRGLCDEIEQFYSDKLTSDPTFSIPNYAMVPGAIKREVTDWDIARGRLGEYLDVDQIKGAANYRLGDLEKALAKTLKLKAKDAKQRINEILNGLIIEKQNAASLRRVKGRTGIVDNGSIDATFQTNITIGSDSSI